jgi:hypothetical protein
MSYTYQTVMFAGFSDKKLTIKKSLDKNSGQKEVHKICEKFQKIFSPRFNFNLYIIRNKKNVV